MKHTLEPGEVCLFCGAIGKAKTKTSSKPACAGCNQPFTRGKRWRLYRGKRWHVACIYRVVINHTKRNAKAKS